MGFEPLPVEHSERRERAERLGFKSQPAQFCRRNPLAARRTRFAGEESSLEENAKTTENDIQLPLSRPALGTQTIREGHQIKKLWGINLCEHRVIVP